MRWRNLGQSDNIEDRRGSSGQRMGGPGIPLRGPIGIVVLLVVIVAGAYGVDLTPLLTGGGGLAPQTSTQESYRGTPEEEEMARFTSAVLKSTEEAWDNFFTQAGEHYPPPKLVLYTGATQTACGYGQAAMGPFYCPADRTVFIDLAFYRDMKNKLGGGGDFAQGYVIAHEVGHHVQHLLGIDAKVRQAQAGASPKEANRLSVLMELQADCFAGVWGHMMKQEGILEAGDLETALNTAQAIGDDRLQRQSGGRVVPDSFTHGSSQQRLTWFKRGFDSGDPAVCDTFAKDK